jgi:ribosomal protein S18 acetylase RimI-like enzyme
MRDAALSFSADGMGIEIREARPDEWNEVGRVTSQAYEEFLVGIHDDDLRNYLIQIADVRSRASRAAIFVALLNGRVIGSSTLEVDMRSDTSTLPLPSATARLRMLGIARDARGVGAGRALVNACIERARQHGCSVMTLNTTNLMTTAQHLYESLGFIRGADEPICPGLVLLSYSRALRPATVDAPNSRKARTMNGPSDGHRVHMPADRPARG